MLALLIYFDIYVHLTWRRRPSRKLPRSRLRQSHAVFWFCRLEYGIVSCEIFHLWNINNTCHGQYDNNWTFWKFGTMPSSLHAPEWYKSWWTWWFLTIIVLCVQYGYIVLSFNKLNRLNVHFKFFMTAIQWFCKIYATRASYFQCLCPLSVKLHNMHTDSIHIKFSRRYPVINTQIYSISWFWISLLTVWQLISFFACAHRTFYNTKPNR